MLIAEDFTSVYNFFGGCALVLLVLALISFVPANRGHWSAIPLAAPTLLLGGYFTTVTLTSQLVFLGAVPLATASLALGLWAVRRHARDNHDP